jgi:hypothetical protein
MENKTNLPTNKTKCLLTKQGVEIWITPEQSEKISQLINTADIKIIDIENETISVSGIDGIYSADLIYDLRRKKSGQWKCESCGRWHPKYEECGCQGGKY